MFEMRQVCTGMKRQGLVGKITTQSLIFATFLSPPPKKKMYLSQNFLFFSPKTFTFPSRLDSEQLLFLTDKHGADHGVSSTYSSSLALWYRSPRTNEVPNQQGRKAQFGSSPSHQTVACKMEAQLEYVHIACTFSHVWSRFVMLGRCLPRKISASELRRKFIKSALLVGREQQDQLSAVYHVEPTVFPSNCSSQNWTSTVLSTPSLSPIFLFFFLLLLPLPLLFFSLLGT